MIFSIALFFTLSQAYGQEQQIDVQIENSSAAQITNYTSYYYNQEFIISGEIQSLSDETIYPIITAVFYDEQKRVIGDESDQLTPGLLLPGQKATFMIRSSESSVIDMGLVKTIKLAFIIP